MLFSSHHESADSSRQESVPRRSEEGDSDDTVLSCKEDGASDGRVLDTVSVVGL